MSDQRSSKHNFKFGKYVVYSIPHNVVVTEWYVAQEGKSAGLEKYKDNKSYHSNYSQAIKNLIDRLITDGMAEASLNMLRDLVDVMENLKEDISEMLVENGIYHITTD